ncbi:amino acid/peptide transporter [Capnocytophaga sp. oral taxon 863 str. F0517]|uniref:peptide MFS transporter n=1 Tax=Capnocytophaga sp. oral taxon 863 TaxID=1227265 RepID=UPI000395F55A|nr:peptide MFS transporter [Capnocytophaga sp. oral taxon 863]ERI64812.1 amino acid/peptide transporter [Capnocytophaga sp. oral taxon 863 str. F0517]
MNTEKKGHPAGLYLVFFTGMWERFSYYAMRGILVLYLTATWLNGGLGYDEKFSTTVYGIATGLCYFTPLFGGWLSDRYLGQRKSIVIGGFIMVVAEFLLFAPELFTSTAANLTPEQLEHNELIGRIGLFSGLFLLIIGNGFFKPNISSIVGDLYEPGDKRLDSAFSIFYMGINLGAVMAPLIVGLLADNVFATTYLDANGVTQITHGYRYGFLAAAVGVLVGQLLFVFLSNKYLGNIGIEPKGAAKAAQSNTEEVKVPLTRQEKERIAVIFIFFFFAVFFFAGMEQAGASFNLYANKYIDRNVFGFEVPTAWLQMINPFFVIVLAPVFAYFWNTRLGQALNTPLKMGLGLIVLGIGFWFMLIAGFQRGAMWEGGLNIVDNTDVTIKAGMIWMILTYFLHTIGELSLSPVGLSIVTKLSPARFASLFMGVWIMAAAFANMLAGLISSYVVELGASTVFASISVFVMVLGILMVSLNKVIERMMHGVR